MVLEDADVGRIAQRLFAAAFDNNGQACVAPKRVYAHQRVYGALVEALAECARSAKVGDGFDPTSELGPLSNSAQRTRVAELVDDASAGGATIVTGGHALPGPGFYYAPTIVTGVSNGVRLVDEEQFGPVLPVMSFSGVEA
ncbi:aldehyde dehydrogenase family protein [Streptomyces sp. NPDC088847]|uniref:aldehyde dehydrogenase family protein n=1 Tax=Streptomyces sp. NPDC088847 TaxID=3365909 RepID=UPI0038019258